MTGAGDVYVRVNNVSSVVSFESTGVRIIACNGQFLIPGQSLSYMTSSWSALVNRVSHHDGA